MIERNDLAQRSCSDQSLSGHFKGCRRGLIRFFVKQIVAIQLLDQYPAAFIGVSPLSMSDYLFKDSFLFHAIGETLDSWNTVRSMFEKKAIFESLEDIADSLIRVRASPTTLDESALKGVKNVLDVICSHCEQELGTGTLGNQVGNAGRKVFLKRRFNLACSVFVKIPVGNNKGIHQHHGFDRL